MSDASEVKRYDQVDTSRNYLHSFDMEEDSTGAWVKYDDHLAAIQKKGARIAELESTLNHDVDKIEAQYSETIARQARVIEKLKRYTQHRVDCICRTGVFQYSNDCDCGLKAIEQGEGT